MKLWIIAAKTWDEVGTFRYSTCGLVSVDQEHITLGALGREATRVNLQNNRALLNMRN